jgi:hypothetical protein
MEERGTRTPNEIGQLLETQEQAAVKKALQEGYSQAQHEQQQRNDLERWIQCYLKHILMSHCENCKTWGVCVPYHRQCGNCGKLGVRRYYDEDTLLTALKELHNGRLSIQSPSTEEKREKQWQST